MTGSDCEHQTLDLNWSLARSNACHIAVQNSEMGELRDNMVEIGQNVNYLLWSNSIQIAIWIFILIFIGKKALSQMWGGKK